MYNARIEFEARNYYGGTNYDDSAEAIQKIKGLTRHYKSTVSEYVKYKREDLTSKK